MTKYTTLFAAILLGFSSLAQESDTLFVDESMNNFVDSVNQSFHFQTGKVALPGGLAEINVPAGFKYLNADQSAYVLTQLWGNPPSETMGLLFPEQSGPFDTNFVYAVEISYTEDGFVDDEDAADIDYDDLLGDMKDDVLEENKTREEMGYPTYELVGWATPPYYDQPNKKLHWAKELKFEESDINTLNYNIRILGRKGYLVLNAIGDINALKAVNNDVSKILSSVEFTEGNRYEDFNPEIDKVAAYGIGGLIAGKVLAKVGFFALILKFWKIIALGAVGLFAGVKKFFFGEKKAEE